MSSSTQRPLIAHILHRLDYGGLENGLVNLLNRFPDDLGRHAVICVTDYSDFSRRIERSEVEIFALHKKPGKDPAAYWRLLHLLRKLQPDLVHTRNPGVLDCAAVALMAGVKLRVHGYHGWDVDDLHGSNPRRRRLRRLLHPLVTRFVTVSNDIRRWLTDDEGIGSERVERIYNGVDTARFQPAETRIASPRLRIGTVGRLQTVKNQVLLIDALVCLREQGADLAGNLEVSLIGDGPERAGLEQRILADGLEQIVTITGWRDDIPATMQALDLFVLPSLNEGISNTVLEAMASGLPVVATAVGGNAELVQDGETGRLVTPQDPRALAAALSDYLDDREKLLRHGTAARARAVRLFSLDAMTAAYASFYRQLL